MPGNPQAAPASHGDLALHDPIWASLRRDAEALIAREPVMAGLIYGVVLEHDCLEDSLAIRLAQKLANADVSAMALYDLCREALADDPEISAGARADMAAVMERDPACESYLEPLLYFKGYAALQAHRIAHWLWKRGRKHLAYFVQMRGSEQFDADIHPGARLGKGVMVDHATGLVIGETAVVGDDVSILHGVTLGGTGKDTGDRHPKIGSGVLIGANASILGNISIGRCSRIGAGSVVIHDIPPCKTAVGVPAKVVGEAGCAQPSRRMDHLIAPPSPPEA